MMNACHRWSLLAVPVIAAIGCSDPVPLPSEGSVTLSIQSVSVSGTSCPTRPKVYQVGTPAPTPSDPGISAIDGDKGASVTCSVQGKGPYTFSGSLTATTNAGDTVSLTMTGGTIDAAKATGTVSVSVSTNDLGLGNFYNSGSMPCTVTANHAQVLPGNPGSIWVNFECPQIANPPSNVCGIAKSTVVFQNCNGS